MPAGWLGLIPVDQVSQSADGTTVFVIGATNSINYACGLAYNTNQTPAMLQESWMYAEQFADGWWLYCDLS